LLPRAEVIVNPNLTDARFASAALAGVASRLVMAALARSLGRRNFASRSCSTWWPRTVADVVPLDRNNRVLVAQGFAAHPRGRCVPGIRACSTRRAGA